MPASDSFSLEDGIRTESCMATLPLRIRVSMSAIGSVIVMARSPPSPARLGHTGNFTGVGEHAEADATQPELAEDGTRPTASAASRVRLHLVLGLALLLFDESLFGHCCLLSFPAERKPEGAEECSAFVVGPCRRDDRDVHAPGDIDLVVVDLRKDELLGNAERVVAASVEAVRI